MRFTAFWQKNKGIHMADEFRMFLFDRSMLDDCVDLFISVFTKAPWNDVYDSREQPQCDNTSAT